MSRETNIAFIAHANMFKQVPYNSVDIFNPTENPNLLSERSSYRGDIDQLDMAQTICIFYCHHQAPIIAMLKDVLFKDSFGRSGRTSIRLGNPLQKTVQNAHSLNIDLPTMRSHALKQQYCPQISSEAIPKN